MPLGIGDRAYSPLSGGDQFGEPFIRMQTFTTALKSIKSATGFSIAEMSRRTGVNRSLITRYLNGANPNPTNRRRLAEGLLADNLHRAGFITKDCEECGTTFVYDPIDKARRFCKRKCNIRATASRTKQYRSTYVTGRLEHDLAYHMEAIQRFCDWCTASEQQCPEPKTCPLARVSPYNYESYN